MATIKDVAKAAGVGTGTVSRALSGKGYVDSEKKKQIIKIAEQLEYDPSALLKRKNNKKVKSGLIGVVLPNSSQPFFGSFLWHVEKALEMHEYRTVIINVGGSSKKISDAIDLVDKHMLDGLIINADVDKSDIERLRLIPAVSFECEMGEGIPLVASDHIKGGELAAKLLFRCGCKNVAILSIKAKKAAGAHRPHWPFCLLRRIITNCWDWTATSPARSPLRSAPPTEAVQRATGMWAAVSTWGSSSQQE